jgi:hypothetical protein
LSKVKQYDHATYLFLYFQKPIEVEYEGEKVNVVTNQKEIDEWTDKDISAQGIIFYNIEPAFQVALEGSGRMPRIRTGIDCKDSTDAAAKFQTLPVSMGQCITGRQDSGKPNC